MSDTNDRHKYALTYLYPTGPLHMRQFRFQFVRARQNTVTQFHNIIAVFHTVNHHR